MFARGKWSRQGAEPVPPASATAAGEPGGRATASGGAAGGRRPAGNRRARGSGGQGGGRREPAGRADRTGGAGSRRARWRTPPPRAGCAGGTGSPPEKMAAAAGDRGQRIMRQSSPAAIWRVRVRSRLCRDISVARIVGGPDVTRPSSGEGLTTGRSASARSGGATVATSPRCWRSWAWNAGPRPPPTRPGCPPGAERLNRDRSAYSEGGHASPEDSALWSAGTLDPGSGFARSAMLHP